MTVRCTALAGDQSRDPAFDVNFFHFESHWRWFELHLTWKANVKCERRGKIGPAVDHGAESRRTAKKLQSVRCPKSHDNCRSRSSGRRNQDAFSPENLIHLDGTIIFIAIFFTPNKKIQIRKCRFYANFSIVCIFVEIWIIRLRRRCCAGSIFHATLICSRLQNSAAHYQTKPTVTELNFTKKNLKNFKKNRKRKLRRCFVSGDVSTNERVAAG